MEEQVDAAGREVAMAVEEKPDDDDGGDEEEEDDGMEVEEEMVEKVMRWLEREISGAAATVPVAARGNCGGTNEAAESCGPTFSDSASTVMASVDTRGPAKVVASYFWPPTYSAHCDAAREEPAEAAAATVEEEEEEWLARVLELDDSSLLLF